ncbi:MAG: hypothetical protein Q8M15_02750 [Bacteroidota bacterium]|nr:hypothetical protein [Bacteroidota bacterium]
MPINIDTSKLVNDSLSNFQSISPTIQNGGEYPLLALCLEHVLTWQFILTVFFITVVLLKWKTIWLKFSRIDSAKIELAGQKLEFNNQPDNTTLDDGLSTPLVVDQLVTSTEEPNEDDGLLELSLLYKSNKAKEGDELLEKLILKEDNNELKNRWRFIGYYFQHIAGNTDAIDSLRKFIDTLSSTNEVITGLYFLGLCTAFSKNHARAKEMFEDALSKAKSADNKHFVDIIINIGICIGQLSSKKEEIAYLIKEFTQINSSKRFDLIIRIAEISDEFNIKGVFYLMAANHQGNDTSLLFNAGYNANDNLTAYSVYEQLIKIDPKYGMAENNLGVSFSNMNFEHFAIKHYTIANNLGITLAAANLAGKLIDAHFYDEAEAILEKVRRENEVHVNVYFAFEKLRRGKVDLEDRIKLLKVNSKKAREFLLNAGEEILKRGLEELTSLELEKFEINSFSIEITKTVQGFTFAWRDTFWEHRITTEGHLLFGKASYDSDYSSQIKKETKEGYYLFNANKSAAKFYIFDNESIEEITMELNKSR